MSVKSDVWKYFQKTTAEEATCTSCLSTIKCKGSSTSGMRNHLKVKHDIRLKHDDNIMPKKSGENISPAISHSKRDYLEETLSRLAAVDMISIRILTYSEFIRKSLMDRGFSMPENENTVMKLIINYFNKKKYELKEKLRKSNEKYSLTIDEWTGSKLRRGRYLRINLHDGNNNWYNLGLVRSFDTITPDIIVKHLNDFGLNFYTDIIACTSAEVIEHLKFDNEIYPETQLCINYAIHLAINDVLYTTGNSNNNDERIYENDENMSEDEWEEEFEVRNIKIVTYSVEAITRTLTAVRKIIFLFRKSTIEYVVLQEHIKKHFGKEMQLIMDDPTRWNTLDTMIERFLLCKDQIKTCLIKLQKSQLYDEVNEILLNELRQTLSPVKVAVDALNNKTANLLTAEAIILFLFDTLSKLESNISVLVLTGLKKKIGERRHTKLSTLIKYLHNPLSITQHDQHNVILYSSKQILINYTKELLDKMINDETNIDTSSTDNGIIVKQEKIDMEADADTEMTLKEQLEFAIKASLQQNTSATNDITSIGTEFTMYEHTSMKTSNLDLLYKAVSTVRPASTEIEQVFSLTGTYEPEYNFRLSDDLLNALVFLKYYFLQRDEV